MIRRDIARTYPEHDFFKKKGGVGQESLFNVMKAYSIHDREVGYCQGSAFIVGLLLMEVMSPKKILIVMFMSIDCRYKVCCTLEPFVCVYIATGAFSLVYPGVWCGQCPLDSDLCWHGSRLSSVIICRDNALRSHHSNGTPAYCLSLLHRKYF